ncbi:MAG: hypothetical protein Fur0012_12850 [Elusimicrobiota bacterium]
MNIVLITCAVVITVTFVFLALEAIETLRQVRKTASEVEKLAINANERLTDIQPAFQAVNSVTNSVVSGWGKILALISSVFKK